MSGAWSIASWRGWVRSGDQWVSVKMISRRTRSGDGGCEAANGWAQGSHWLTRRYNKIDRTKTERHDFWSRTERIKSRLHVTWLPRLKWCISSHATDLWTLGLVPLRIWKPESVYLRPKYSANCPFLNNFSFKMTRACMIRKIIFQILPDAMREYFGETWLVANHFRVFCLMGAQHNQTRIR